MLTNNLRTALRNFLKYRTTTALNISGLTLGVAVCLLISVWLQRELSYDRFHPEASNIFRAYNTFKSESESFTQAPSATGLAAQLPKQMPSVTAATRVFRSGPMFKIGDKQFVEEGITADANFFSFFGFKLLAGDPETVLASANNVVLTEQIAIKYFWFNHRRHRSECYHGRSACGCVWYRSRLSPELTYSIRCNHTVYRASELCPRKL